MHRSVPRAAVAIVLALVALVLVVPVSGADAQAQHEVPFPEPSTPGQPVVPTAPPEPGSDQRGPIVLADLGQMARPADAKALHVKLEEGTDPELLTRPNLTAVLSAAQATVEPLFARAGSAPGGDLSRWVRVEIANPQGADRLFDVLNELEGVEAALPEPVLAPATFAQAPSVTPNYEPNQLYLKPAPEGVDADYATTIAGGSGSNVSIADIEYSWNTAHEDLSRSVGAELLNGTPTDPFNSANHGTAVIGILSGDDNGLGVTGVTSDASLQLVNVFDSSGAALAEAINLAAANSSPGDVLLIEQQLCAVPLVGGNCAPGWLPVEWFPSYYDAIVAAVESDIIVVEPAGNGGRDLDSVLSFPDSGAILVGAANPSNDCTSFGGGPPRSRLFFSNYGTRVDMSAHGACVWTTGSESGAVDPSAPENQQYTALFSGTSSAAAIVAGAAASLSSIASEAGDPLGPNAVRALLRATGTPQDVSIDSNPIGPMPDLRSAIGVFLDTGSPPPTNDDFYTPTTLSGLPSAVVQETVGASVQAGEPISTCGSTDTTVWFIIAPQDNHDVTFTLQGSAGQPSLAVWEVAGTQTLGQIGCSAGGADPAPAALHVRLRANKRYSIQVGASGGSSVTLTATGTPTCDLNADGFGDQLIGVPGEGVRGQSDAGAVNVFYGHRSGDPDRAPLISQASAGIAGAAEADDRFGSSVACGDIDGDGYDDAVIGVAGESRGSLVHNGAVQVLYGSAAGIGGERDQLVSQASGTVPGKAESGDRFGSAVAVGDINGDGFDDVVVGAPGEGIGSEGAAGMVTVLYGSNAGLSLNGAVSLHQNKSGMPGKAESNDEFGSVLAVGDVDQDGFGDIYIGVPGEGLGVSNQVGAVVAVGGGAGGAAPMDSQFIAGQGEGARFGSALALGDLNGDSNLDLAVGSPQWSKNGVASGSVSVFAGSSTGLGTRRVGLVQPGAAGVAGFAERGDRFGGALVTTVAGPDRATLYIGAGGEDLGGRANAGAFVRVEFGPAFAITGSSQISQKSAGVVGAAEPRDRFGEALATENLDGDAFVDLMVAAPGEALGSLRGAGMTIVLPGAATGLDLDRNRALHQNSPGVGGVAEPGDEFGAGLG